MKCAVLKPQDRMTATVRTNLQRVAAAACVLMVLLLAGVQLATPGTGMPPTLWLLFTAVWIFGAAMLWWFPTFGAVGTAIYGVVLGWNVLTMHGVRTSTVLIAIGSFVATGLAVMVLVERLRSRKAAL